MPTRNDHADEHDGEQPNPDHRRLVRSELDLLGVGITSLLADEPCHYSPLVLVGSPDPGILRGDLESGTYIARISLDADDSEDSSYMLLEL